MKMFLYIFLTISTRFLLEPVRRNNKRFRLFTSLILSNLNFKMLEITKISRTKDNRVVMYNHGNSSDIGTIFYSIIQISNIYKVQLRLLSLNLSKFHFKIGKCYRLRLSRIWKVKGRYIWRKYLSRLRNYWKLCNRLLEVFNQKSNSLGFFSW